MGQFVLRLPSVWRGSRSENGEESSRSVDGILNEIVLKVLDPNDEGLNSGVLVELAGAGAMVKLVDL